MSLLYQHVSHPLMFLNRAFRDLVAMMVMEVGLVRPVSDIFLWNDLGLQSEGSGEDRLEAKSLS